MSRTLSLLILLVAAVLEAGGDALLRSSMHASTTTARVGFLMLGAIVLCAYGYAVNRPPWDFGRLIGVYVAFFFLFAQVISWLAFNQRPTGPIVIGGAFVVVGGVIMSVF